MSGGVYKRPKLNKFGFQFCPQFSPQFFLVNNHFKVGLRRVTLPPKLDASYQARPTVTSTQHLTHYNVHTAHCTHCTKYIAQSELHNSHCTTCIAHFTHCTKFIAHFTHCTKCTAYLTCCIPEAAQHMG